MKKVLSGLLMFVMAWPLSLVAPQVTSAESPHSATIAVDEINGNPSPFNFSCPNNPLFSPVTVSGSGVLSNPQGQFPGQYHVSIDWGDGSAVEVLDFDPLSSGLTYTATPGTGNDLTVDYDYTFGAHSYTVNTGFTITVKVYHAQNAGQDATDAIANVVTTCVVPNPATLNVIKHVVGGTLSASDFNMHIKTGGTDISASPFDGAEAPGTAVVVQPGTYVVSEDPSTGYTATFSGGCDSNGNITLGDDETKTCTVTNTFNTAPTTGTLLVQKVVVNDNSGTKVASDFSFQVNGGSAVAFEADGQNDLTLTAGAYTVTEVADAGYNTTYSAGCTAGVSVGLTTTCTITNNDVPPPPPTQGSVTVTKVVTNDNGGTAVVSNFTLKVGDTNVTSGAANNFNPGTYVISETGTSGYTASYSGACANENHQITVVAGETYNCTITNNDQAGTLIVKKVIVGGSALASNFSFQVNGGLATAFEVDGQNDLTVNAGTYGVTEVPVSNYTASYENCSGLSVTNGGTTTCTITNTFVPPHVDQSDLSLTKTVDDSSVDSGTNVVFTITVLNNGLDAATGVVVNDLLGSGFTYVSDDGAGAYVSGTGVWTVGNLANGASAVLHITATASGSEGATLTNTATTTDNVSADSNDSANVNIAINTQNNNNGDNGGTTRTSGGGRRSAPAGEVLGATTDICDAVDSYMRIGHKNDSVQVTKLQNFLNGYMNAGLGVDGMYGPKTEAAVKTFQTARKEKVLFPWGLTLPTGIFYKTSLAEAKRLACPDEFGNLPIPTDLIPWSENKKDPLPPTI